MNALTPTRRPATGRNITARHKSVARMVGFVLAADDAESWQKLPDVLACRLSPKERGALALMALMALPDDAFDAVLRAAIQPDQGRAAA